MLEFFRNLLKSDFMPHGQCWSWEPWVVWTNAASDLVIAFSYTTISAALVVVVRRRRDLAFDWMFLLFGSFIFACGLTHAMDLINVWNGYFRLAGAVKMATALVSLTTALFLIRITPQIMGLPSLDGLSRINETLRLSEAKYRRIVETAREGIWKLDLQGRTTFVNARMTKLLGFPPEEMLGHPLSEFIAPGHQALGSEDRSDSGLTEVCFRRKEGGEVWALLSIASEQDEAGQPDGTLCMVTDITHRKEAARHLRDSEERFRLMVEGVKDYAICLLDVHGQVANWNASAERIQGYGAEEVIGKPISLFYLPLDVAEGRPAQNLEKAARTGRAEDEAWRVRKDGSTFFANVIITALRDARGELKGFVKITRDITERQMILAELQGHQEELEVKVRERTQELAESQHTLSLIYESVGDPLLLVEVIAGDGVRIVSCNKAQGALMRAIPEDLRGREFSEVVSMDQAERWVPIVRQVAETGRPQRLEWRYPEGKGERIYDVQVNPIHDPIQNGAEGSVHILVVTRDVTERHRGEEALLQAQKLESLGVLAGGIAHDFNNLLTSVLGNASLGDLATPASHAAKPYFAHIEKAALKAADLTRQLLAYAGKGRFEVAEVNLNRVVKEMTQLLSVSISKKVALRFDLARDLPWIKTDPAQMQQLVMNLVTNASEAIGEDEEGTITIRTGTQILDQAFVDSVLPTFPVPPGCCVKLEVSDTGSGMTPEVLARIFDPFFTTKFTGRGLGLSAMMGILRSHSGGIQVQSEPGKGSTFTLFLPTSEAAAGDESGPVPAQTWRADGLVLVVDDEPGAQSVARAMAESLGFSVLEASDGRQALALFAKHHRELLLVLMDLTMPHMDGREAYREMRKISATVPVILSSGYSQEEVGLNLVSDGLSGFLQKPYQRQDFIRTFRRALGLEG